jgi:chromosome segregation ATPase
MEVSPTGQGPAQPVPPNDPVALLHLMVNLQNQMVHLQNQSLEMQRQTMEMQRQQLELSREMTQVSREQRQRQISELERWQQGHEHVLDGCRESLTNLEQVHAALMGDLANYVRENYENLLDGEYALTDFVDRFGPRLAHLNTMLAVLRPLAAAIRKTETTA